MAGYIGTQAVSVNTTSATITGDASIGGNVTLNEGSADVDFRVETNANANAFIIDGGNNTITADSQLIAGLARSNTAGACAFIVDPNDTTVTYGFRIDAATNSFNIDNANNARNLMSFDITGAVTMPLQPAFLGHSTSNQTNVAINTRVDVIVAEVFDQNADFTSNTFTAPVAGRYQLNFSLRLEAIDSAATFVQTRITTSNRDYEFIFDPDFGQDNAYYSVAGGVVADMDASDTAKITIFQGGGTAQMDINGASFSGSLAC